MKSIVLKGGFGIDRLALTETAAPEIGPRDILVGMKAASLNYVDFLLVKGALNPEISPPFIPVADGAGVVEEIGGEVRAYRPGGQGCDDLYPAVARRALHPGKLTVLR